MAKCFALKGDCVCDAAKKEYADEMMITGACGTTGCIFYKPNRQLIRIGNKFYPAPPNLVSVSDYSERWE